MFLTSTFLQDLDPTFTGTRECKFLAVKFYTTVYKKSRSSLHQVCLKYVKFCTFIRMNRTLPLLSMKKTLQSSQTLSRNLIA